MKIIIRVTRELSSAQASVAIREERKTTIYFFGIERNRREREGRGGIPEVRARERSVIPVVANLD